MLRGADDPNPIAASSVLINAYVHELDRRDDRPAPRPRSAGTSRTSSPATTPAGSRPLGSIAARGRDPPGQRRAHQRRPLLRRPRPPGVLHARVRRRPLDRRVRPGGRADPAACRWTRPDGSLPAGPGDRRLQEQLRRQGQLLRLPRELPDGPGRPVRPHRRRTSPRTSSPARSSAAPGKVGCEAGPRRPTRCRSSSPSGPTSSRRRSGSRPRSSGPSSTPATSPTPTPQKYRRLHVIIGDANLSEVATFLKVGTTALVLAMIEDDFLPREFALRLARCGALRRVSYDLTLQRPIALADGIERHRPRDAVGAVRPGPQVRRRGRPRVRRARPSAPRSCGAGRACSPGSRPIR